MRTDHLHAIVYDAAMTVNEAAEKLGLDSSTLRHQIRNGSIRATKRGRDWWISPSEVQRYRSTRLGHVFGRAPQE